MRNVASFIIAIGFLCACSSSGGSANGTEAAKFLGSWGYASGEIDLNCNGSKMTQPLVGTTETFVLGTTDAEVVKSDSNGCAGFRFEVSGNVASAEAGQSCTVSQMGTTATIDESSYTLTLAADGKSITTAVVGTFTPAGAPAGCAATGGGTLTPK